MPKEERSKRAREVAETIGLTELLGRYPRELSGGQRQRVAMGRAIIRNPKAFLFDEPLSNLDAALRVQMRKEIRALHDRLGATSVYVTHDQIEAMTMADHVVVMRDGVIEQQGAPLELYDQPANKFVAGFIGSPAMNFVAATGGDDGQLDRARWTSARRRIAVAQQGRAGPAADRRAAAGALARSPMTRAGFHMEVGTVELTGSTTYLASETDDFTVVQNERTDVKEGDRIALTIDPKLVHLFDAETGTRI